MVAVSTDSRHAIVAESMGSYYWDDKGRQQPERGVNLTYRRTPM
jgi:hypothetical protein